jgi:hypothetical protein
MPLRRSTGQHHPYIASPAGPRYKQFLSKAESIESGKRDGRGPPRFLAAPRRRHAGRRDKRFSETRISSRCCLKVPTAAPILMAQRYPPGPLDRSHPVVETQTPAQRPRVSMKSHVTGKSGIGARQGTVHRVAGSGPAKWGPALLPVPAGRRPKRVSAGVPNQNRRAIPTEVARGNQQHPQKPA